MLNFGGGVGGRGRDRMRAWVEKGGEERGRKDRKRKVVGWKTECNRKIQK